VTTPTPPAFRSEPGDNAAAAASWPVPTYLSAHYSWAYVDPRAVRFFERQWLANLILFGNYARLRDAAIDSLAEPLSDPSVAASAAGRIAGRTLQIACAYGDLTPRLQDRLDAAGELDVVDVLPVQLSNLQRKLGPARRARLLLADASRLGLPDASYDRALLFFLLHEVPHEVRRATLAEAIRVLKPGGRLVIVDYAQPYRWNPLGPVLGPFLARVEPFALDLWRTDPVDWLPRERVRVVARRRFFGGLYRLATVEITAPPAQA